MDEEVQAILAKASHTTWMKQAERDKKIPAKELSVVVTPHDIERARDAVKALDTAGYKIVRK